MTATLAIFAAAAAAASSAAAEDPEARRNETIVVTGERTEANQDYSTKEQTTATRLPLSRRETPQSVSVVTRAQIEDFQLNDVNALLATVPGVNVQAVETDRIYYSARGFDIQTFQIDGLGLPFAFGVQTGSLDTAIFDHVEVLKGAPGLLSPTGNPSAVINFVRKRPTTDLHANASAQYGSFDNVRLDGDVSVPLNASGSLRVRGVGAFLDTDSYLDRYHLRRWTGYGVVEADLTPSTTVSVGYAYQSHKTRGSMWGALPLTYDDGTRIDYKRSASEGPDWAHWNVTSRQIFGDVTQQLGGDWIVKISAIRNANSEYDNLFYVAGNPNRTTGLGFFPYIFGYKSQTRDLTLDGYVAGKFKLLGREHEVTFGFNRGAQYYNQYESGDAALEVPDLTLTDILAGHVPKPTFTDYSLQLNTHRRRESVYGLVRLSLADPLKLLLGANYTHAESDGYSYGAPEAFSQSKFLPFVGGTYDFTANLTTYVSYAKIFRPQTELGADHLPLTPVLGDNLEAGIKGEWFGGRLNASAAIWQAHQKNLAEYVGFDPDTFSSIYEGIDARSQGIEFEIAGQLTKDLQLTGGYTILRIRDPQGNPVRTYEPRQTARLNLTWSPPALDALKLGAAIQYQSRVYRDTTTSTGVDARVTQGGYALFDLMGSYDLTRHVRLSLNLRNVGNVKYLTTLHEDQAFFGAPRSVLGTIGWKY